jgi:hypothetical protein
MSHRSIGVGLVLLSVGAVVAGALVELIGLDAPSPHIAAPIEQTRTGLVAPSFGSAGSYVARIHERDDRALEGACTLLVRSIGARGARSIGEQRGPSCVIYASAEAGEVWSITASATSPSAIVTITPAWQPRIQWWGLLCAIAGVTSIFGLAIAARRTTRHSRYRE